MNTFYQLWGTKTPKEAKEKIDEQIAVYGVENPKNLEEQALSFVGKDIYETLIKQYTEKQWGRKATELPAFIIKRLPIRFTFDNNYFNDRYQGIPIGGYNKIIENLLKDVEVKLDTDYFENKDLFENIATKIVFTGKIDQYFDYKFGKLEYRSLRFETEILETDNFQGNAGINYNDDTYKYTRIVEHKHFEFGNQKKTVITKEYPENWTSEKEAFYPINDMENQAVYSKYKKLSDSINHVIFGGRLAEYKYYDMHQIIASALIKSKKELENG
jgi:UDP-galactopyranose mutase